MSVRVQRGAAPASPAQARSAAAARTVSAIYAQAYVMFGVKHGLDAQRMCALGGIRPADIVDRDSQIPIAWANALLSQLIAHLPQLSLGIELGLFSSIDHYGYLGQALRNCRNALEALKLLARSIRLLDSGYRQGTLVVEAADTIEMRAPYFPEDFPEGVEMGVVTTVSALHALAGGGHPREVRFAHARNQDMARRFEQLFGCPVHFGGSGHVLVFDRATLERPVLGANDDALRHFDAHVGKMLDRLEEPLVAVVTRAIDSLFGRDDVTQARVAKLLGQSTRSLRRALKEQGKSYQQLLGEARRARAELLLANRTLAVSEVAFALGYDDVSAFTRAFRHWTGQTPRAFRDGLVGAC